MFVVSDTSPLTNLLAIERLQLLSRLYDTVAIPEAVLEEISVNSAEDEVQHGLIVEEELQGLGWVEIMKVVNRDLVESLLLELDLGEAEAISLAVEANAELLLIDERKGRDVAKQMGVRTTGLIGILVEAKQKDVIPSVKPILERLKNVAGFWISDDLFKQVLREVGEDS